jgi:hypothetical protein
MAERQQKLLANRITGTPRLSEQAIDDEKPPSLPGLTGLPDLRLAVTRVHPSFSDAQIG